MAWESFTPTYPQHPPKTWNFSSPFRPSPTKIRMAMESRPDEGPGNGRQENGIGFSSGCGLEKAKKELEEAKAEHDVPIPVELLKSFPVPDVKSIKWIPVESVQEGVSTALRTNGDARYNSPVRDHIDSDGSELPFFVEYDHVQVRGFLCQTFVPENASVRLRHYPRITFPIGRSERTATVSVAYFL